MTTTNFCVTIVVNHYARLKMKTAKDYIVTTARRAWDRCGQDCLVIGLFLMVGVEVI
jgi:hypothetical protein